MAVIIKGGGGAAKGELATPTVSSTGLVTAGVSKKGVIDTSTKKTLQLTAKSAQTYTPTTTDQTIPAGRYTTGIQTIKGDANLKAENIKSGVSIFGINGSSTPLEVENGRLESRLSFDGTIENGNFIEFADGIIDNTITVGSDKFISRAKGLDLGNDRVLYLGSVGSSYGYIRIVDYSTKPITVGASVQVGNTATNACAAYLGNDTFVIFYYAFTYTTSGYRNVPTYRFCTIQNGNEITLGDEKNLPYYSVDTYYKCFKIDDSKILFVFNDYTTYCSSAVVITRSGDTFTCGTILAIDRNGNTNLQPVELCEKSVSNSLFAIPFNCSGNWNKLYLISRNGDALTLVTNTLLNGTNSFYFSPDVDEESNRIIFYEPNSATVYVYNVTNDGFTLIASKKLTNSDIGNTSSNILSFYYVSHNTCHIIASNMNYCYSFTANINESDIVLTNRKTFDMKNICPEYAASNVSSSFARVYMTLPDSNKSYGKAYIIGGNNSVSAFYTYFTKPDTFVQKSISRIDGLTADNCTESISGGVYVL